MCEEVSPVLGRVGDLGLMEKVGSGRPPVFLPVSVNVPLCPHLMGADEVADRDRQDGSGPSTAVPRRGSHEDATLQSPVLRET